MIGRSRNFRQLAGVLSAMFRLLILLAALSMSFAVGVAVMQLVDMLLT